MRSLLALLGLAFVVSSGAGSSANRLLIGRYLTVHVGSKECAVEKYGAKGDGKTDDTKAVQAALDDCGKGGGRVSLAAGKTYLVYSVAFAGSNTELHIPAGATLLGSDSFSGWANGKAGSAIIVGKGTKQTGPLQHLAITGAGTVDGQGLKFWKAMKTPGQKNMFRPHTVDFDHVTFALLTETLYTNGPNHILELGCDHCELSGIKVLNPPSTGSCEKDDSCSHNTDAVDVHGSPFWVHDVNFTTGDDNIAGHANHTLVEDSYFGTGHGASIGSLCNSYITNFTVRNCTFVGTTAAARIKSHPGCGGHVWDVTYQNLTMCDVGTAVQINQFYFATKDPPPSTMRFERVSFKDITSTHSSGGSHGSGGDTSAVVNLDCDTHFNGVNNCNVTFDNVHFIGAGAKAKKEGMVCKGVRGSAHSLTGINDCLQSLHSPWPDE